MWGRTAKKLIIFGLGAVAATMVAAGCGSSGETTASAPVTRAQVIKQAAEICAETRDEREAAVAAWEKKNGKTLDFNVLLKEIVGPLLKEEAQKLQSLEAPAKDQAKLARMAENLSKGATSFIQQGSALKSASDIEAFKKEANAYGLQGCSL